MGKQNKTKIFIYLLSLVYIHLVYFLPDETALSYLVITYQKQVSLNS